jgi:hypothetical protein
MTKRTRYFMFGSVTVLLVGLCTGLVAYYTGMPMGAFGRSDGPAELRYVPADATLVAYADVQDVMRSEFRQKLRAAMNDGHGQEEFQKQTGIDIEHDIDHVIAFVEPGSSDDNHNGMVIAAGRFDAARLEALAREHEGLVEEYKGKRMVSVVGDRDHDEKPHGDTLTVAFLDPGLIALGQTGVVKRSIDRQGGQSVLDNHEMMNLVRDLDNANAWAVGRFDTLISQARLPQGVAGQIPAVRWFSASGHINGGLRGTIRAEARDEQAGQNLRDVVQGFMALAKMQAGQKPELTALVNSIQLSGTGKTVSLNFEVPSQIIDAFSESHRRAED